MYSSKAMSSWAIRKIGVIGPGIVGMPMAVLLANARIRIGTDIPAKVVVIQRNSVNSGWKVDAINQGKSVIGGIEPDLDNLTHQCVAEGLLSASSDINILSDADVILVSIQTDKSGFGPDYGPLFEGLSSLAIALKNKPVSHKPLLIFESTLAPSSMLTVIKGHFEKYGLIDGKDILLGNSPNRVMPGRLIERVTRSDKLVAGINPETPRMIKEIYQQIVTEGTLHITNCLTAEVTKTLENAYRDVRIAFSTEIVRFCDKNNIDFYTLRNIVNKKLAQEDSASCNPNAVPSGGMLIPTIGVGGHCLPKDGILLWWRKYSSGEDTSNSLILHSRIINDYSPTYSLQQIEQLFGEIEGKTITVLGAAYRFNSEDTRNSPTLQFALQCLEKKAKVIIHDPFVKSDDQNLKKYNLAVNFTNDLDRTLIDTEILVLGTSHKIYCEKIDSIIEKATRLKGIYDGCNAIDGTRSFSKHITYSGIGRGKDHPSHELIDFTYNSFRMMERGVANEVSNLCDFLNKNFTNDQFNIIQFSEVQRLCASCSTGCIIADTGEIKYIPEYEGFKSELVEKAYNFRHTSVM